MTRNRLLIAALSVLVLILGAGVGYDSVSGFELAHRLTRDEHATCVIQARGLPAGHQLADSMADIHTLLTLPARPDAPATPLKVQRLVADLNMHLARYSAAEGKQPATRSC